MWLFDGSEINLSARLHIYYSIFCLVQNVVLITIMSYIMNMLLKYVIYDIFISDCLSLEIALFSEAYLPMSMDILFVVTKDTWSRG